MIKLSPKNTDYYSYFFMFTKPVRKLIIKSPDGVFLESSPWVNMGNNIKISPSVLNYTTNKREIIGNFTSFDKMVEYYENIIKNNTLTDNEVDEIAGNFNTYISNENLVSLKKVWDGFTVTNKCKVISAYRKKFNKFLFDDINYTIWDRDSNDFKARESLKKEWNDIRKKLRSKDFCCNNYQVCW